MQAMLLAVCVFNKAHHVVISLHTVVTLDYVICEIE